MPEPRQYVVGLPVIITVNDEGTVTYEVDTAEAGLSVGKSDEGYPFEQVTLDVMAVEQEHYDRMNGQASP